ncbi:nickel/cobalt transporter [Xanthobacter dioxanivorans]|uniref:Nickel/cobalt efflux system n=1 Tax=Xanthobacter dioxanivorans TaxID=2528964 RepID=A0A974PTL1_9HYPH|nr:nickel/cobalt transporter [Xanthobacter dioxanivorans]QRG09169.1 nickel/cobalt transporter [Xanthobacter dioxanivorans]
MPVSNVTGVAAPLRRATGVLLALGALLALALLAALLLYPEFAFAQGLGGGGKPPTPFGLGGPPGAAAPSGVTGFLLAKQAEFYLALKSAVRAAKAGGHAFFLLAGLSFAYGVFHAAGPGHGKAVISSYILADGGTLRRGAALSLAAGVVQAMSAILLVSIVFLALNATSGTMDRVVNMVEIGAYGGIGLFGLYLAFVKGRRLVAALRGDAHAHDADCGCGDAHAPDPALLATGGDLRRAAVAVLSAGARPCSGAIIVLSFALAQGVFASGVGAVFAMGLGTALTVTLIAAIAVYGKRLAVRLAGARTQRAEVLLSGLELTAAMLVMLFGFALLTGYIESERLTAG